MDSEQHKQATDSDPDDELIITGNGAGNDAPLEARRSTFFSMPQPIGGEANVRSHRDAFLQPKGPPPTPPQEQEIPPAEEQVVERSLMTPEAGVLLITTYAPERNVFRTYLREHEVNCRAAINPEHGLQLVLDMKPTAVLVSGSQLGPDEILTFLDDLCDLTTAPVLLLLSAAQRQHLEGCSLPAAVLEYPASLKQIRVALLDCISEDAHSRSASSLRDLG